MSVRRYIEIWSGPILTSLIRGQVYGPVIKTKILKFELGKFSHCFWVKFLGESNGSSFVAKGCLELEHKRAH